MQSLKYLADEIEILRHLVHDFVKDATSLQNMVNQAIQFPYEYEYIDNGKLEFILPPRIIVHPDSKRPELTMESGFENFGDLTLNDLSSYLPRFYKEGELVVIPIKPNAPPPQGNELVNLALGFFLKNCNQGAYIFAQLKSSDGRVFKIYIRHDRIPRDYKKSGQYQSYKRIVRRIGDLANKRQRLIPFRIQIDENTKSSIIWTQLLLCATAQNYLCDDDNELFEELKVIHPYADSLTAPESQQLRTQVLDDLIMHLFKHRPYPYSSQSFPAYLRSLKRGYTKKVG